MRTISTSHGPAGLFLAAALLAQPVAGWCAAEGDGWASDWAVAKGFSIAIDTEGYRFPTAIAFVPNPGAGPKDPLYFVAEIRGTIKVVTNDRSVIVFADDFVRSESIPLLPAYAGEQGLAGLCLDPDHGYVFATYAYRDAAGVLRNNISRFDTRPLRFATRPTRRLDFTDLFSRDESAPAHQIGPCQVVGDSLYVSVGDGEKHWSSRSMDTILGKVLRMTLDGDPWPGNPAYRQGAGPADRASYVWAYGLRNPFSLEIVADRIFVADNGLYADRFLELHEGEDYLWSGTDWSIGARADMVFSPSVGPVQMDYLPGGRDLFPVGFEDRFYVATTGNLRSPGPSEQYGEQSILALRYDFENDRMAAVPEVFLSYRGSGAQGITGLAFGPDGLYFAPVLPDAEGRNAIFKIVYAPDRQHPVQLANTDPLSVIGHHGCMGCHALNGTGNDQAPTLDAPDLIARIGSRLDSQAYRETLGALERAGFEPGHETAVARILALQGTDRVRAWIIKHLQDPGFDNPDSQMPDLDLSEAEAAAITSYLIPPEKVGSGRLGSRLRALLMKPLAYGPMVALACGFLVGVTLMALVLAAVLLWRSRAKAG